MTAAIFGLLGVFVGGVVNGVIAWRLERLRELRNALAAARLVHFELVANLEMLAYANNLGPRFYPMLKAIEWSRWTEETALLARELDDNEWLAINKAYAA